MRRTHQPPFARSTLPQRASHLFHILHSPSSPALFTMTVMTIDYLASPFTVSVGVDQGSSMS